MACFKVRRLLRATGGVNVTGALTVSGAMTFSGATALANTFTVGENDTGYDVKFFGATSGAYMLWDEDQDTLALAGAGMTITGATGYAIDIQTTGQFRMGIQGTGIPTATATPFAMEIHSETGSALTAGLTGLSCGIRSRYEISVAQPNQISLTAIEGRLRVKANIADGTHSGVSGTIESDGAITYTGTGTTQWNAGNFCVELGSTCVFTGASGWLTGVTIDSSIHATQTDISNITYPALRIKKASGKLAWQYGIYIDTGSATTGIYIDPGCTYGLQIGAAATVDGSGLTVNATAPVGFYFDDGGTGVAAWSEAFTVGLVLPTASTGAAQTGFPSATHIYIDQQANITGPAAAGKSMTALWAGYLVRGSSTLDGFDDGCVSAAQVSCDVASGATLAAGTTMGGIQFGGNWSLGTVSGTIFPLVFTAVNADWTGFMKLNTGGQDEGLVQDAAATGGSSKYLKVYIGTTLYTIEMTTA